MSLRLGPFEVVRRIGEGGMAEVWSGRHAFDDTPVALKVITSDLATDPAYLRGFEREVEAVAGLDHPGIVQVHDCGFVSGAQGEFTAGSPWLAMELATHGDLLGRPPRSWSGLRRLLLEMLDALAHAHARGVIHRDLKPANVLLATGHTPLLSDFGIAHVVRPGTSVDPESAISGTPHYMAPEQLQGRWRDYGPWTDLYALGCVAFELAGVTPPFSAKTPLATALLHLDQPVPKLIPGFPVPDGFEAWLGRLLRKRPAERYETAADAAAALASLVTWMPGEADGTPNPEYGDTVVVPRVLTLGFDHTIQLDVGHMLADAGAGEVQPLQVAPVPPSWREGRVERPMLRGAGLGLFEVRAMPLVDREGERDALWGALREVAAERKPRVVVVEGDAGVGKTALVRWLARRAAELGVATALEVTNGAPPGPTDGLPSVLGDWFGVAGLDRGGIEARVAGRLRTLTRDAAAIARDAPALSRLVAFDAEGAGSEAVEFAAPGEYHAVEVRLLHKMARRRPLVLCVYDAQWAADALGCVAALERAELSDAPILVVLAVDPGALAERPIERELLGRLGSVRVGVGPLARADSQLFVERLLGLEPNLAERLLDASAGSPLYAVRAVGEWVAAGRLRGTPQGFALQGPPTLAPDASALFRQALARACSEFEDPDAAYLALETAAALGQAVYGTEWRAACAALGVEGSDALVASLRRHGLARDTVRGWGFTHSAARRALLEHARRVGRMVRIQRACSGAVSVLTFNGTCPAERAGRHLVEARAYAAALPPLLAAGRMRLDSGLYRAALVLADLHDAVATAAGLGGDDPRRLVGIPVRIRALRYLTRIGEAEAALDVLRASPTLATEPQLAADALLLAGNMAFAHGRVADALQDWQRAAAEFEAVGDAVGAVRAIHGQGWALMGIGQLAAGRERFEHGREVAEGAGLDLDLGWCLHGIAAARLYQEEPEGVDDARAALELFRAVGSRGGIAGTERFIAEFDRRRGDFEAARQGAERAVALYRDLGSALSAVAEMTLAAVALAQGDPAAGLRLVEPYHAKRDSLPPQFWCGVPVYLAIAHAGLGDADSFERYAAEVRALAAAGVFTFPEVPQVLRDAPRFVRAMGHDALADAVAALADLVS